MTLPSGCLLQQFTPRRTKRLTWKRCCSQTLSLGFHSAGREPSSMKTIQYNSHSVSPPVISTAWKASPLVPTCLRARRAEPALKDCRASSAESLGCLPNKMESRVRLMYESWEAWRRKGGDGGYCFWKADQSMKQEGGCHSDAKLHMPLLPHEVLGMTHTAITPFFVICSTYFSLYLGFAVEDVFNPEDLSFGKCLACNSTECAWLHHDSVFLLQRIYSFTKTLGNWLLIFDFGKTGEIIIDSPERGRLKRRNGKHGDIT